MTDPAKLAPGLYAPPGVPRGPAWPCDEYGRPSWCKCGREVAAWRVKKMAPDGQIVDGPWYIGGQCGGCAERETRDRARVRENIEQSNAAQPRERRW